MTSNTTTPVNNLAELLISLRTNTINKTTEEAFDMLQSLIGNDIRIRYEVIKTSKDSSETKENYSSAQGGRFSHLNGLTIARVLLTSTRTRSNFSRELVRTCNGVVLEYPAWKVLSVPSPMFNPSFRIADITNAISDYSIYEIKDGTTVTLYWYNDPSGTNSRWCMSSTNGFDVSNYQWMGPSTYHTALTDVAKQYPDFRVEQLDHNKSYTIGFRHNDFHPLINDPAKMWLIQTCDLSLLNGDKPELCIDVSASIGLPLQTQATLPSLTGQKLMRWIQNKNESSLNKYLASARDNNRANLDIHYGYVLRSNTLADGLRANSNIILESELLKQVRFHMYNLPKRRQETVSITADNRLEYTVLRAFLSCNTKYVFLNLFPQFSEHYHKYDSLFSKLANRIIAALRNRNVRDTVFNSVRGPRTKDTMALRIDRLASALVSHIEKAGRINVLDPQGPGIILDFIMDKKYLDLYYACLFAPNQTHAE